ncbi:hypothetical protein EW640_10500 [Brevibacterium luteolum]|uniref:Glycosyl-4,4'-diaponeurosporenoate acyltransferase n=1 Tax=Brevibacterium luteolum TaxID=199591 RepID=A0A6G8KYT3_9MICO|nr:hypothetical protein EW640_10500 [Brevibacterium luteolum]
MSSFPVSLRGVLVALLATALGAGGVAAAWVFIGPTGFAFAWITHFLLMGWISAIITSEVQVPHYGWLRVREREVQLYRALGVRLFGRLLDAIGWNRLIAKERGFDGTREGLKGLDQHTRRSESSHIICLLITLTLSLAVLATGSWAGAIWLTALGIPLHLYPALLQRLIRARIQAVPAKY